MCAAVGICLAFKPVWVHPVQRLRIKGIDDHDLIVYFAFLLCGLLTLLSTIFLVNPKPFDLSEITDPMDFLGALLSATISIVVFVAVFVGVLVFFLVTLVRLVKKIILFEFRRKNSIRSFYCYRCMKRLKRIRLSDDFLTETERVAWRLKSIFFESWYCSRCFPIINYGSIHLRAYINESKKFCICSECDEITMIKTSSRIIKRSTTKEEGKRLVIYTCQYCGEEEEKIEVIPKKSDNDGS